MLGPSRRRADAVYGGQSRRRPHRLVAQDTALSRRRHGFESRWGHARLRKRPALGREALEGLPETRLISGPRGSRWPAEFICTERAGRLAPGHAGQPRRRDPASRVEKLLCMAARITSGAPVVCSSGRRRLPSAVPITGTRRLRLAVRGPVEQLGVLATLSRWRSRVQIPSGPQGSPVRFHWGPNQVR